MLYLGADQIFEGGGVASRATFVRVEHRNDRWTLKLDDGK
jgi:hypothetical protein